MSERGYGLYSKGSSGWTSFQKEELQEEDVWDGFQEREEFSSRLINTSAPAKHVPIPITKSSSSSSRNRTTTSAPVHIPDWSKIYGGCSYSAVDGSVKSWGTREEDEDDEEGEEEIEPPHEWLAKKYARDHKISSFSVCEGVGRTLKGRDLSRVRNAVLTKTGFLE